MKQSTEKKFGFTIVELAIVLVVIGIILSMALKGKQLVEVAMLKREVQKIRKLETAFAIYYAKKNGLPKYEYVRLSASDRAYVDMQAFYDLGLLTEKDLTVGSSTSSYMASGSNLNSAVSMCKSAYLPNTDKKVWAHAENSNNSSFDRYSSQLEYCSDYTEITVNVVCEYEKLADDANVRDGNGRVHDTGINELDNLDIDDTDCLPLKTKTRYRVKLI